MILQKSSSSMKKLVVSHRNSLMMWASLFILGVMMTRSINIGRNLLVVDEVDSRSSTNLRSALSEQHVFQYDIQERPLNIFPSKREGVRPNFVDEFDYIYEENKESWDSAPIVIESHKLVFFTIPKVGCTVWKQLFRRMMKLDDWSSQDEVKGLPHNPYTNGLKYLNDYSTEEASIMMTSPEWTRAIMVRDPKIRFLSAFIDKAIENNHHHIKSKCCKDGSCIDDAQTLGGFLDLCHTCKDEHWHPQNDRVDQKYWPYMDYVLSLDNPNVSDEARRLLTAIGAWEDFGASGWGKDGTASIFQSKGAEGAGTHARYSQWRAWQYYTPELEKSVEEFFEDDYRNPFLNFTRGECLTCVQEEDIQKIENT